MIDVAVEYKVEEKLSRSLLAIQKMLKDRVIEPIERFVDHAKTPIGIDEKCYKEALENLNVYRPDGGVHNELIALNLALACYLTKQKIETTFFDNNDNLYYVAYPTTYRSVANSRQSVEALRRIKDSEETYISCCPQFISMLILLKKSLAKELGIEDWEKRIIYLKRKGKCIERLKNKCLDMQFPQRFTQPDHCKNMKTLKKNLLSTHNYLRDLIKFGEQIYPSLIKPVLKINQGNTIYHDAEGKKNYNGYVPIESLNLHETQNNEPVVYEDYKSICEVVEYTYIRLYEYATKNKLITDMGFAPKTIVKLSELYDKVTTRP
jgi:hypothetical protein